MVDYAINYTKITTELCENREKPELLCKGFCYLKQEVNKTEKNTSQDHFIKNTVKVLDAIVPQKQHISPKNYLATQTNFIFDLYQDITSTQQTKQVFHPPIV